MVMYRATSKGNIPLTPEEEAEFLAMEPSPPNVDTVDKRLKDVETETAKIPGIETHVRTSVDINTGKILTLEQQVEILIADNNKHKKEIERLAAIVDKKLL